MKAIEGLTSSVAVFVLDFDSELLFVGDAGTTVASRPSRRVGVEWVNQYKPKQWLSFDLDLAYTRARFTDFDPAGDRIPGAPAWIASGAITLGSETGWFGALKARYFGPRPLIEDDSVHSLSSLIFNARAGYRFDCSSTCSISSTRRPTRLNTIICRACPASRSAASLTVISTRLSPGRYA
jgi:outer membrane receptor protein involved in Fe transport